MHEIEHAIEQELTEKLTVRPGATREKHLIKLVKAAGTAPEEVWESLSTEAQEWVNAGIRAYKASEPIPDFPGVATFDNDVTEEAEATDVGADLEPGDVLLVGSEEPEPVVNGVDQEEVQEEFTEEVQAEEVTAPKARKTRGKFNPDSVESRIKLAILDNPNITAEQLMENLKNEDGTELSKHTVSAFRVHFRHSLRLLNSIGRLNIDV